MLASKYYIPIVILTTVITIMTIVYWFNYRQAMVADMMAKPSLPYSQYTMSELDKKFPQTLNKDVATERSPEQTHGLMLSHLKKNEFKQAVQCCFVDDVKEIYEKLFVEVEKNNLTETMVADLEIIKEIFRGQTLATYSYEATLADKKVTNIIEFVKDDRGIWLIKKI